jgi:hypothetical protein
MSSVDPLQSTKPGRANLTSATGETIEIDFTAHYTGPAAGSSAWSIVAENIRLKVTVPQGRTLPDWILGRVLAQTANGSYRDLIEQCMLVDRSSDRGYLGEADNALLIRAADSGIEVSFRQLFAFAFAFGAGGFGLYTVASLEDHPGHSLVDPINRSIRFQTDLFFATPYATTDQGQWA